MALVLSPIIGLTGATLWLYVAGDNLFEAVNIVVSVIAFALIVWKARGAISRIIEALRTRVHEPLQSCIEFGVSGAFLAGGVMLAGILLLGHMRPESFDWDRILPVMGIGFIVSALFGWPIGVARRRKRNPS